MSNIRRSHPKRRIVLALALLASALAACETRVTAPGEIRRAPAKPAAIEGDTLSCTRGWVIIAGAYVCNES